MPIAIPCRRATNKSALASAVGALALAAAASAAGSGSAAGAFSLVVDEVVIPQVDYEGAIYYAEGDPLPHVDFDRVAWNEVVHKPHERVVLETAYLRVEVLPRMGRVYAMVHKPTGNDVLWKNDIVRPGGARNPTGWWLWIGGIEYTLPGYEHGTTFAMPWRYEIVEDSNRRKALAMEVVEPLTGLRERIALSVYPGQACLETEVGIHNPGSDTVEYAHWINPMWAPGGQNEVTDSTEIIIPTQRILVEPRWQANLGPSPQEWASNPLRYIRGWKAGDIMADGLTAGYYSAYSHDAGEGVVRVFDPLVNPGVDVWTYGFHPGDIPMGSGAPNRGYVEMWGGTSRLYPDETRPLPPGEWVTWTEWIYPYAGTGGLTAASPALAANCVLEDGALRVALAPAMELPELELEIRVAGTSIALESVPAATPGRPILRQYRLPAGADPGRVKVAVRSKGLLLLESAAAGGP